MYPVLADGKFMGYVPVKIASWFERQLRMTKANQADNRIPYTAEVRISNFAKYH